MTRVVRSMTENASSPTLLMSEVIRSDKEVAGRVVAVVEAFAVPAIADTLMILVKSIVVMARIESRLRIINLFPPVSLPC